MFGELAITFGAGLLGFLSPCVLPVLPGYVAYMTGASVGEKAKLRDALPGTLAFVGGLALIFVSLGASASAAAGVLSDNKRAIEIFSGIFVIALGIMLAMGRTPFGDKRLSVRADKSIWRPFLMGAAFAFAWTPCVGPTLGVALSLAANSDSLGQGVSLLGAYSLGIGLPFVAVGLGLVKIGPRMKRNARKIQIVGAVVLILVGILVLTGRLTLITIALNSAAASAGIDFWNI